jgi:hypothetical protein
MAVEPLMLLTLPVLAHTTRSELQSGHFFQYVFLLLASLWFGQYKAAFEWFVFLAGAWLVAVYERKREMAGPSFIYHFSVP